MADSFLFEIGAKAEGVADNRPAGIFNSKCQLSLFMISSESVAKTEIVIS
jgi:hypothetical protein